MRRDSRVPGHSHGQRDRDQTREIADHLGCEHSDPAGRGSDTCREGTAGPVELELPRDRNGMLSPVIVPQRKHRLGQVEDVILSLYACGMSTREMIEHPAEYGANTSAATISRVTDAVSDEITARQSHSVDPMHPNPWRSRPPFQ